MNKNNKGNKEFNLTLSRGYAIRNGFWSVDIGPEEFDAIQNIEQGGRLVFKVVGNKKTDKSPDGYFEYISKDKVQQFKAEAAKKRETQSDDSDF